MKTLLLLIGCLCSATCAAQSVRISQLHRVDATQAEVRWIVKGDASKITRFELVRTPNGGNPVTTAVPLSKVYSEYRALLKETTYVYRDRVPAGFYTYKVRAIVGTEAKPFSEIVVIKP